MQKSELHPPLAAHPGATLARSNAKVLAQALAASNGAKFQVINSNNVLLDDLWLWRADYAVCS